MLRSEPGAGDEISHRSRFDTSEGAARDGSARRYATVMPATLPSVMSHSPVCRPARISSPSSGPRRRRPARSGSLGRVRRTRQKNPSPAVSISRPRHQTITSDEPMVAFTTGSCRIFAAIRTAQSTRRCQVNRTTVSSTRSRVGLLLPLMRETSGASRRGAARDGRYHGRRAVDAGEERTRYLPGHRLRLLGGEKVAREHQGRDVDRQEHVPHVPVVVHAQERDGRRRTRRQAIEVPTPVDRASSVLLLGGVLSGDLRPRVLTGAHRVSVSSRSSWNSLEGSSPTRIVRRPRPPRPGVVEDTEGLGAPRVGRRTGNRVVPVREGHHDGALEVHGIKTARRSRRCLPPAPGSRSPRTPSDSPSRVSRTR